MADQRSTTGIQITCHDGHLWFLSVQICIFYKFSKAANTEQVNFIKIEEAQAKHTIEQLKMKTYLTSNNIEFWGDREMLRVAKANSSFNKILKVKEVPNG